MCEERAYGRLPPPMKKFVSRSRTLVLIVLCSIATQRAGATLIAYEGFDYTAGESLTNSSANSAGDSFGWAGRWTGVNVSLATNAAASLGYDDGNGHALASDGGKVIIGAPAGISGINAQPSRSFNFGTLNAAGNVYSG